MNNRSDRHRSVFGIAIVLLCSTIGHMGAIELSVTERFLSATESAPFWLEANQWGLYDNSPLQNSFGLSAEEERPLLGDWRVGVHADVDAYVSSDGYEPRIRFAYGQVSWRDWELKGGAFAQEIGELPFPDLSTGSMSVSGNARPIPKVQLSLVDFMSIPGTDDFVQIKGGISHGWFTGERVIDDALLHEKWGYAKLGKPEQMNLSVGLVHQVQWGGEVVPVSWDNYWRVFTSRSGSEEALVTDQLGNIGNTVGIWDFGLSLPFERFTLQGYYHHYFELLYGVKFRNGLDGLWGLAAEIDHDTSLPRRFVFEYFDTRYQGGPYHNPNQILSDLGIDATVDGRFGVGGGLHNYYSHGVFRNGWTHRDRILGSPLIIATGEGENLRIASNRVEAIHFGFSGQFTSLLKYRLLATGARHRPSIVGARGYAPRSIVPEGDEYYQWSLLLGLEWSEPFGVDSLALNGDLAMDRGELFEDSIGMLLGATWSF